VPAAETDLLAVSGLRVEYRSRRGMTAAVSGASFTIRPGEVLGLVGESGSGKTTIGRALLGLVPASAGTVRFLGQDITRAKRQERRRLGTQMQVVFQDPYGSLNPAVTVGASLLEALPAGTPRQQGTARMAELLEKVGLPAAAAREYPARFSGGQRQRLAVARALMPGPRLVVCDEPVSALDLSVQAQVLNLLRQLRAELSLSYLFIGHDLDVVRFMSDRILVLYRGRVLEEGPAAIVATTPRHPYTQALAAAAPHIGAAPGAVPAPAAPAAPGPPSARGCPYAHRCPLAIDICRTQAPALETAADGGAVACHRYPTR
jgi:peptide/nickel transport system ATP-binding protein